VAPGHKVLATQFSISRTRTPTTAVFGAVGSLLRRFEPDGEGGFKLDVDLRLEPGETRIPHCPLP
jgi:catechol 1,2-dioxygenase